MRARILIAVKAKYEDNFGRLLLVVNEATLFGRAFAIKSEY
jgi:hypothetical protein